MKNAVKISALVTLTFSMVGCSNQMLYNMIQSNQRTECYQMPNGQLQQCLDSYQMSYAEYLSARREHSDLDHP